MQAILTTKKRFFRKYEQRNLKLPLWPELSIARVWPEATQLPRFNEYVPNEWSLASPKKIERDFFFGVLISLAPEYVEQLILDIRSQRIEQNAGKVVQQQAINVSHEWID